MKNILLVIAVIVFASSCNTMKGLMRKETKEIEIAIDYTNLAKNYYELALNSVNYQELNLDSLHFYTSEFKKSADIAKKHLKKAERYQKLLENKLNKELLDK